MHMEGHKRCACRYPGADSTRGLKRCFRLSAAVRVRRLGDRCRQEQTLAPQPLDSFGRASTLDPTRPFSPRA